MLKCQGCKGTKLETEHLCLICVEDLSDWLGSVPLLYAELAWVRLPGSAPRSGPQAKQSKTGPPLPVRPEVMDLETGTPEVLRAWCETVWPVTGGSAPIAVYAMARYLRRNVLTIAGLSLASDLYHAIRHLHRALARTVGEPEVRPVGTCSCGGPLYAITDAVICKRCGTATGLAEPAVWVLMRDAATITGKPIETIRTWRKRKRVAVGQLPAVDPAMVWLPDVVRLANSRLATLPQLRGNLNHSSGAEPSADCLPCWRWWTSKTSAPELSSLPTDHLTAGDVISPAARGSGGGTEPRGIAS